MNDTASDRDLVDRKASSKKETRKPSDCCASCKWLSDDFTSVCVNSDSPRCADFVSADYWCKEYEVKRGTANDC